MPWDDKDHAPLLAEVWAKAQMALIAHKHNPPMGYLHVGKDELIRLIRFPFRKLLSH
jgi:hypothetical protein